MKLKIAVFVFLLVGVAAFFGAPYYTVHQIRQALANRDAVALARHVDFEQVRANLKAQMLERLSSRLPAGGGGAFGLGRVGMAAADALVDATLSKAVTPEHLLGVIGGQWPVLLPGATERRAPSEPMPKGEKDRATASYAGWNVFEVQLPTRQHGLRLLLTREGVWTWRLTHLLLPPSSQ